LLLVPRGKFTPLSAYTKKKKKRKKKKKKKKKKKQKEIIIKLKILKK
jgi:hypothetical protein